VGRILAVDYGRKRVGLAVTDPTQVIANGLDTVRTHDIIPYLRSFFRDEEVEKIVIGYPVQMNNKPSESTRYIDPFIKRLHKEFPEYPIEKVDERFTSKMALQAMIDGGVKKKDRRNKALVDKVSAVIILQSYLEKASNTR
jgi:putative Holliday junction resolvase